LPGVRIKVPSAPMGLKFGICCPNPRIGCGGVVAADGIRDEVSVFPIGSNGSWGADS
jgi:hypothetical protein